MKHFNYSLFLGLTIFAIMFGAGNIILPPSVGFLAGKHYFLAILALILTSAGFSAIGVWSMALQKNNFLDITRKIHPKTHLFLLSAVVLILGPLFAAPRTSIITGDLFVTEIFGSSSIALALGSFIFFSITAIVLLSKTNLIDVIGKYLTPVLIVLLAILIGGSLWVEPSFVNSEVSSTASIVYGLKTGYFTVDALGYVIIATISIKAILAEKSMKHDDKTSVLLRSVIIALVLISLVYLGLGYMGATTTLVTNGVEPSGIEILRHNIFSIFGKFGNIIFGLSVALACLTTSIGLIANASNFFAVNSKTDQKIWIVAFTALSFTISLFSLDNITSIIGPLLLMLVPPAMCLAFLGFVNSKVRKRRTLVVPFFVSIVMGVLTMLADFLPAADKLLSYLPFGEHGFSWIPVILGSIVVMMAYEIFTENRDIYEEYTEEYRSLKATD